MRCNNCGMDYIQDNSAYCPRCNAPLGQQYQQPPQPQYQQPESQYQQPQQYQQPPQPQYAPPQGGYYQQPGYQQPPMPPRKTPTVKRVDLTEILMVISGMFLVYTGFFNLSMISSYWGITAFELILGLLALVVGAISALFVLMPQMFKQLNEMMDMLIVAFAAVFILWGLLITFAWDFGSAGESALTGGLGLLVAGLLRMGIIR